MPQARWRVNLIKLLSNRPVEGSAPSHLDGALDSIHSKMGNASEDNHCFCLHGVLECAYIR